MEKLLKDWKENAKKMHDFYYERDVWGVDLDDFNSMAEEDERLSAQLEALGVDTMQLGKEFEKSYYKCKSTN